MSIGSRSEVRWRFRPATPDDEPMILDLFERSVGVRLSPRHWQWRLSPAMGHQSFVGVDDDDRPVFHYGGLRQTLEIDGARIPIMVAVDAFTDPTARRSGLLTRGGLHAHRQWRDEGYRLVLGLPNEQWGTRAAAVGFEPFFRLRWWARVLRPARLLSRRLGLDGFLSQGRPGRHSDLASAEQALDDQGLTTGSMPSEDELATLIAASRGGARFRPAIDRDRWTWRYLEPGGRRYRVVEQRQQGRLTALAAIRIIEGGRTAIVSAIEGVSLRSCRQLLRSLGRPLRSAGIEIMMALAPARSALEHVVLSSGLLAPHRGFELHAAFVDPELPLREMQLPRQWWISGGDFDVA